MKDPELKAADERLEAALEESMHLRGYTKGVNVEWLVLAARTSFDDDGDQRTGVYYITSGDGVPHYRLLGMLDFVATGLRADIGESDTV